MFGDSVKRECVFTENFADGSMSGMVALICFWNFGIHLICDNDDSVHLFFFGNRFSLGFVVLKQ